MTEKVELNNRDYLAVAMQEACKIAYVLTLSGKLERGADKNVAAYSNLVNAMVSAMTKGVTLKPETVKAILNNGYE